MAKELHHDLDSPSGSSKRPESNQETLNGDKSVNANNTLNGDTFGLTKETRNGNRLSDAKGNRFSDANETLNGNNTSGDTKGPRPRGYTNYSASKIP